MKHYTFFDGLADADLNPGFETSFFNRPEFCHFQKTSGWVYYHLLNEKTIIGSVCFQIEGHVAKSPSSAPFGSFEFADGLEPKAIYDFISQTIDKLQDRGVSKILIKAPPDCCSNSILSNVSLLNQGFRIVDAEIGTLISINNIFETRIDSWEHRKLKQAASAGLTSEKLPVSRFAEAYNLIEASRTAKKYPLSMSRSSLEKIASTFPDRYILHGVFQQEKLIAASIGVLVKSDWFYNFYSDHDAEFDHLSPVVLLMKQLYVYCQSNNIAVLDLGTSSANNVPNFGLLEFKMRLGGKVVPKYLFEKNMA